MEKAINDILKSALTQGACSLANEPTDAKSLVSLFFSPQGKEFCAKNDFPSLQMFRQLDEGCQLSKYGVYVDCGLIYTRNIGNTALIGKTQGELKYEGVERKYTVILMHGAKATIKARNHAVIEVVNIGDCMVEYDIDKTVVLL